MSHEAPAAAKPNIEPAPFTLASFEHPTRQMPRGISSRWANSPVAGDVRFFVAVGSGHRRHVARLARPHCQAGPRAAVDTLPVPPEITPMPRSTVTARESGQGDGADRGSAYGQSSAQGSCSSPRGSASRQAARQGSANNRQAAGAGEARGSRAQHGEPFKKGDTFLQELVITQKSRFVVSGISAATMLTYRIASRYTVQKVHEDGAMTVEQKIEAAELILADDLTQGLLADRVTRMPGTAFTLESTARGEVTKFTGAAATIQAAKLPGGLGVQMASLLDADGWKEMAQATFYQPEQLAKAGVWTRPTTHNWGPLGDWAGKVSYAYPGPAKGPQVKIPYTQKIAFQSRKGPGDPGACAVADRRQQLPATASRRHPALRHRARQGRRRRGALLRPRRGCPGPPWAEHADRNRGGASIPVRIGEK